MATRKNNKATSYSRIKDICIDMYTVDKAVDKQLMRGRFFLNCEKGEAIFKQNLPRGLRSVEIGRTRHSRYVRRPDGDYTVTFRCRAGEKDLVKILSAEIREIAKKIESDYEWQKNENLFNL